MALSPLLEGYRRHLKSGGFKVEGTPQNLHILRNSGIPIPDRPSRDELVVVDPDAASRPAFRLPTSYKSEKGETVPLVDYAHQIEAKDKFRGMKGPGGDYIFALFAEMGTGKTKIAIDLLNEYYCDGTIDACLVITKRGVHEQWVKNTQNEDGEVVLSPIAMFTQPDLQWVGDYWKGKGKKIDQRIYKKRSGFCWFTINFDAMNTEAGVNAVKEFIEAHRGRIALVGDETHYWKNPKAGRTEAVYDLRNEFSVRGLMTGTPIAKNVVDEWSQFRIMDEDIIGIRYLSTFQARFCVMGGPDGFTVLKSKNLPEFKALTENFIFRILKKDCLGLPEKQYRKANFSLSTKQRQAIAELKATQTYTTQDGKDVFFKGPAPVLGKIQEISNGFIRYPGGIDYFPNPRLDELKTTLEDHGEKAIIWCRFKDDIAILKKAFGKKCVTYYGPDSDRQRAENKAAFINDPDVLYLLATGAAAEGLDGLQSVCSLSVYYSNTFNSIHRWQSEDRTHRIGMGGSAVYLDLIARNSIDARVLKNLRSKKAEADLVLDVALSIGLEVEENGNTNSQDSQGAGGNPEGGASSKAVHAKTNGNHDLSDEDLAVWDV